MVAAPPDVAVVGQRPERLVDGQRAMEELGRRDQAPAARQRVAAAQHEALPEVPVVGAVRADVVAHVLVELSPHQHAGVADGAVRPVRPVHAGQAVAVALGRQVLARLLGGEEVDERVDGRRAVAVAVVGAGDADEAEGDVGAVERVDDLVLQEPPELRHGHVLLRLPPDLALLGLLGDLERRRLQLVLEVGELDQHVVDAVRECTDVEAAGVACCRVGVELGAVVGRVVDDVEAREEAVGGVEAVEASHADEDDEHAHPQLHRRHEPREPAPRQAEALHYLSSLCGIVM